MNYLLYIDTSTDIGTIALSRDSEVVAVRTTGESRNHAASINIMINEVLADTGININQLSAIVVCAGPGSYTGLRIGMATAKGLCYVSDIPLYTDNKLTLLAHHAYINHPGASQYISLVKAREKEYFISVYKHGFECTLAPQHIMESQLSELIENTENTYIISDASTEVINQLNLKGLRIENNCTINTDSWAKYALEQILCNRSVNLSLAEPFYLKEVYTHK